MQSTGIRKICEMKIAVRMDDITPDMNWENFYFFQALFEKAGITPLLGIVPENRDENLKREAPHKDFYKIMAELGKKGYCFAMHGCYHLYTTKRGGLFPLNHFSEFAGVPYEEQKKLLTLGKRKLEEYGIVTDMFMAPAHSYDKNTLKALKELGFTKMTDGFGKAPYRYGGFTFYPIAFRLNSALKKNDGVTTMVLHANTVSEADKKRYERIFNEYGEKMISYSEYLREPSVRRTVFGTASERLAARIKFMLTSVRNK